MQLSQLHLRLGGIKTCLGLLDLLRPCAIFQAQQRLFLGADPGLGAIYFQAQCACVEFRQDLAWLHQVALFGIQRGDSLTAVERQ